MPIYAYRCRTCNAQLEQHQRISASAHQRPCLPLLACPGTCGARAEKVKQLTAPAFSLQGGGYYRSGMSTGCVVRHFGRVLALD